MAATMLRTATSSSTTRILACDIGFVAPQRGRALTVIGGFGWGFNAYFFCCGGGPVFTGGFDDLCAQNVVICGELVEKCVASVVSMWSFFGDGEVCHFLEINLWKCFGGIEGGSPRTIVALRAKCGDSSLCSE